MDNIFNEPIVNEPIIEKAQNDLLEKIERLQKEIIREFMNCNFEDMPKKIIKILSGYFQNAEEIYIKCIEIGKNEEHNYNFFKVKFNALFKELEKVKI